MNKFKYPEESDALSDFVLRMKIGDAVEINDVRYTMEAFSPTEVHDTRVF